MAIYVSDYTGEEMDEADKLVFDYFSNYPFSRTIGIEWDQSNSSPTIKHIDLNNQELTLDSDDFNAHSLWGSIKRCVIDPVTFGVTYGVNARGDGLDLTGASGNVMVEIPKFYVKSTKTGTVYRWWLSPVPRPYSGFEVHPAFLMRGGAERSHIYIGAYASVLRDNAGTLEQHSKTGEQPWTGGEIDSLAFSGGLTEFTVGETLTGATSGATGDVVDYHVASGTWAGNDAAGTVYLKQVSVTDYQAEILNGSVAGAGCSNATGANSPLSLTIDQMETYANNIGSGWGETNFWTLSAAKLLMFTEFGTMDSQTALGRGVVDLAIGAGFAGVENGVDSADTNVAENGTGTGTGINGYTSVVWRGIENPYWGNIYTGVIGYNAVDSGYRLVKRDGTGTLAAELTAGNYEESVASPITTVGYIKDIEYEDLLQYAFIGSDTGGSSTTYIPDNQTSHVVGETNVLFAGGYWNDGLATGVGRIYLFDVAPSSFRFLGARLEYIPQ